MGRNQFISRKIALLGLLAWAGMGAGTDEAAAQYRYANPRFSKVPTHHTTPSAASHRLRTRDDGPVRYRSTVERTQPTAEDLRRRARQAVLHGAADRGIEPIPSEFSSQLAVRTSGQRPGDEGAERIQADQAVPMDSPFVDDSFGDSPGGPTDEDGRTYGGELEYRYDDGYYEEESWAEGGGCWEQEPCAGCQPGGLGACRDWCSSTFCGGNTSLLLGVVGFKGSPNLGRDGSFGFQQGVNFGTVLPFWPESGIGWQVGARTIQANIAGTSFAREQRNQTFFTSGFYRRCPVGLNAGFVFDLLQDKWYSNINVGQVRAQFSWRFPHTHEWGYWFAAGDATDQTVSPLNNGQIDVWNPRELNAFFYRRHLRCNPGGTATLFAGWAGDGDGLIGANAQIPFNHQWSMQSSFTYLSPNESNSNGGSLEEAWNVSMALVWTLGGHCENRFSPMFDVADNGSFILHRTTLAPNAP